MKKKGQVHKDANPVALVGSMEMASTSRSLETLSTSSCPEMPSTSSFPETPSTSYSDTEEQTPVRETDVSIDDSVLSTGKIIFYLYCSYLFV